MGKETSSFFFLAGGSDKLLDQVDAAEKIVGDQVEAHVSQLRKLRERIKSKKLKIRRKKAPAEEPSPLNLLPDIPPDLPEPAPAE